MLERIQTFFLKNEIHPEHILYLCRGDGKSVITMKDGRTFETYIPAKKLSLLLPEEDFVSINKGVYVNRHSISNISDGFYTMADGRVFQGRVRTTGEHKKLQRELYLRKSKEIRHMMSGQSDQELLRNRYRQFDTLPVAFYIIEPIFDKAGNGIDFIYRYGNTKFIAFAGGQSEWDKLRDHSFMENYENADPKWLVPYGEIALHGGEQIIIEYAEEINREVRLHCYQPEPGLCGCIIIPDNL